MDEVTLRKATPEDASAARSLIGELGYRGLDPQSFARSFAAVLAEPAQGVWIAELGGRAVGLMSLSVRPQMRLAGMVVTIDEMVVTESARGIGIGAHFLELARDEASRVGARRLELQTARRRASYERAFYVKNGFREVDSAVMRWDGNVMVVPR
jgi:GNAT superfamily N-acetyltransferase